MRSVLVVAHEAKRNGATMVLLHVLPHLARALAEPLAIELRADGGLASELRTFHAADRADQPGAVLVNSALAADALMELPPDLPSVVWVHEVGHALERLVPAAASGLRTRADHVFCVSRRARDDLVALGVEPTRIQILPPVVQVDPAPAAAVAEARRDLLGSDGPDRAEGSFDPSGALVLGCGEATWRKGTDLFLGVARSLRADPTIRTAWVGRRNRAFAKQLDHDVALAGLQETHRWAGEVEAVAAPLAAADVVVMTSREDPQPLVPLEAALVGTPTVGFAGTGLDDLAALGACEVVPYPDVDALARTVRAVLADPTRGERLVAEARALVERERSCRAVAPQLEAAIRSALDDVGRHPDHHAPEPS